CCLSCSPDHPHLHSFPTRRSSDLARHRGVRQPALGLRLEVRRRRLLHELLMTPLDRALALVQMDDATFRVAEDLDLDVARRLERSEEHTSELQSLAYLVCRLLLEK